MFLQKIQQKFIVQKNVKAVKLFWEIQMSNPGMSLYDKDETKEDGLV